MASFSKIFGRALMIAVPSALGLVAIFYSGNLKTLPQGSDVSRPPALVRVITVERSEIIARVSGFGTVTPARDWRAVARIEGEVIQRGENLAPGNIVDAGTVLFSLDDTDLKLSLAAIDAQISASKIKDDTIRASRDIAQADLALAEAELARQEQLATQGVVAKSALDGSRRQVLVTRAKMTELSNQITLNTAERAVLTAQRASVDRALEFSKIRAPFDLRITAVSADVGQFVTRGQVLLSGEGIEAAEITAQFPMGQVGPLLRFAGPDTTQTNLKARVTLPSASHPVFWDAKVDRIGDAIDERTQTAPLIVRVDAPQAQSNAGERPPLRRNMVVQVDLLAPKRRAIIVPAEAIQNGQSLVVSNEGKLERRAVQIGLVSGDVAVVAKGLSEGDQLVISEPSVAVPGMTVKAVEDDARKAQIAAEALGQQAPQPKGAGKTRGAEK